MKTTAPEMGLAGMSGGQGKGGFGRGLGAFGGNGLGAGLGNRAGFVGRPVMGAFIRAKRVAVYLDCSGSMRSYLPRVEAEIRKEFPDADVYRFDVRIAYLLAPACVFALCWGYLAKRI
jgi:hypothetical protein